MAADFGVYVEKVVKTRQVVQRHKEAIQDIQEKLESEQNEIQRLAKLSIQEDASDSAPVDHFDAINLSNTKIKELKAARTKEMSGLKQAEIDLEVLESLLSTFGVTVSKAVKADDQARGEPVAQGQHIFQDHSASQDHHAPKKRKRDNAADGGAGVSQLSQPPQAASRSSIAHAAFRITSSPIIGGPMVLAPHDSAVVPSSDDSLYSDE